jgi:BirA family biotin operon repressor/biotin-[acetyl-CoA-carboxylase] ligase
MGMKAKVLQLLRDHSEEHLSGEKISEMLGCSRTMVWKYIDALRKEGYKISAVPNKGYRIANEGDPLSEHEIVSRIKDNSLFHKIVYYDSLESTQTAANKLVSEGADEGTVVIADEQTGGRGRLGRKWESAKNSGIWMSLILRPAISMRQAPQLTLITAVAAVRAVEAVTNAEVHIKWPNDILMNGRKLAGILTEMQADPDRVKSVIIGIGLNVNQTGFEGELSQIATSLAAETGGTYSRSALIAVLLKEFEWIYELYLSKGFSVIKPMWEAHASTIGRRITASNLQGEITGVAEGIDEDGVLLLRDDAGELRKIYSADISFAKS